MKDEQGPICLDRFSASFLVETHTCVVYADAVKLTDFSFVAAFLAKN